MRIAKNTTILLVALFAAAAEVSAQTSTGEVNGSVTDNSGGAISGAAVRLTNQGTNVSKESHTNANGYFVFINVLPGSYVLTVENQGFKTAQVSAFDIEVNQTLTQNIRLDVGAISESVTVNAEAPLLQSSTSELGTVIAEKPLKELPLNGRNFTQLLILTPGINANIVGSRLRHQRHRRRHHGDSRHAVLQTRR
jgi:Carboxypeptidase regulatory-like domain